MLLKVNLKTRMIERVRGEKLRLFNISERDLQDILFHSLDRLLSDEELLLIMQSRLWQEEPDLMALDKDGSLYIFELKAWESQSVNLLQVLRYGQIYGNFGYADLQRLYAKFEDGRSLKDAHRDIFGINLREDEFNHNQIFVAMTNGLDYKTREAVQYWRRCGLEIRPWVYRAYPGGDGEMLLEISPFTVKDNPYEDITGQGYYIINTNYRNAPKDHEAMLSNKKAAAYFTPWKYKIARLSRGDVIFLYQSGVGIVAVGAASGSLEKHPYQGNPQHPDEEYSMSLKQFKRLNKPVPAVEIKEVTGVDYRFMSTMFALDAESGKKLYSHVSHH